MTGKRILLFYMALVWSGVALAYPITFTWRETSTVYWRVTKGRPYAVWSANSEASPGSVSFAKSGEALDKAHLIPEEVVRTEEDMMEGKKLLLPKGSTLIKMRGNIENIYCTLRYGNNINQNDFYQKISISVAKATYLCITRDASMISKNPVVMQGFYPALFTIFRTGSGLLGQKIGNTNPIQLSLMDRNSFEKISQLRIMAKRVVKDQVASWCLQGFVDRGFSSAHDIYTEPLCFSSSVEVINIWGGVYRFRSTDNLDQLTVEIEKPISEPNLAPAVIQ